MGKIYVTDKKAPESACAHVGGFAFYAGIPDASMILKTVRFITLLQIAYVSDMNGLAYTNLFVRTGAFNG